MQDFLWWFSSSSSLLRLLQGKMLYVLSRNRSEAFPNEGLIIARLQKETVSARRESNRFPFSFARLHSLVGAFIALSDIENLNRNTVDALRIVLRDTKWKALSSGSAKLVARERYTSRERHRLLLFGTLNDRTFVCRKVDCRMSSLGGESARKDWNYRKREISIFIETTLELTSSRLA